MATPSRGGGCTNGGRSKLAGAGRSDTAARARGRLIPSSLVALGVGPELGVASGGVRFSSLSILPVMVVVLWWVVMSVTEVGRDVGWLVALDTDGGENALEEAYASGGRAVRRRPRSAGQRLKSDVVVLPRRGRRGLLRSWGTGHGVWRMPVSRTCGGHRR
ncbi:splicing factor PWI domain-containing protein isoform X1 [Iris pallida]|uniref:Splicing factor PWI domain-containing protein isoform X1 n=1 Tax=Iris pallida TaxID=29817 RepID=A0AAX6HMU4_IRIPA|nr:splicing factor PWI domain-containing protein isoform X1 [Iris pallida]